METKSRTLELCLQGIDAEFQRCIDDARGLYRAAWEAVEDDYDACVAAHYIAHLEPDPHRAHEWNLEALRRADAVADDRVTSFYPSLYVNLGRSFELMGDHEKSAEFYAKAEGLGLKHQG